MRLNRDYTPSNSIHLTWANHNFAFKLFTRQLKEENTVNYTSPTLLKINTRNQLNKKITVIPDNNTRKECLLRFPK